MSFIIKMAERVIGYRQSRRPRQSLWSNTVSTPFNEKIDTWAVADCGSFPGSCILRNPLRADELCISVSHMLGML
jgi:hypothetical protein